jgi:hypothetical protein
VHVLHAMDHVIIFQAFLPLFFSHALSCVHASSMKEREGLGMSTTLTFHLDSVGVIVESDKWYKPVGKVNRTLGQYSWVSNMYVILAQHKERWQIGMWNKAVVYKISIANWFPEFVSVCYSSNKQRERISWLQKALTCCNGWDTW